MEIGGTAKGMRTKGQWWGKTQIHPHHYSIYGSNKKSVEFSRIKGQMGQPKYNHHTFTTLY